MSERHPVVCQELIERERGWGMRPDGASLHLTESDRVAYYEEYWERERKRNPGDAVPDEYTSESGHPTVIDVDDELYERVKQSKNGIELTESQYTELRKKCLPAAS
jgi:hypothetical protein